MNLPIEILVVGLLIMSASTVLLIRYAIAWRADMRDTQMRLIQVEEEIQRHPQICPVKKRIEELAQPRPVFPEKNTPEGIEMIRQYIQIYHPNFMNILMHHTCEKLTPSDELLCMMIRLEYSNKEIASILSITTNSVITARYRLKKKLSLTQDQQLDVWLQEIGKKMETEQGQEQQPKVK